MELSAVLSMGFVATLSATLQAVLATIPVVMSLVQSPSILQVFSCFVTVVLDGIARSGEDWEDGLPNALRSLSDEALSAREEFFSSA